MSEQHQLELAQLSANYEAEIARLHAEVERLQYIITELLKQKDGIDKDVFGTVCFERDEALVALNDAKKALKIMNQNLDDLSRVKQEALAQVAVLLDHVTKFPSEDAGFYFDHIGGCQYPHGGRCSCGMEKWSDEWDRIKENLPAEARALLDRLQNPDWDSENNPYLRRLREMSKLANQMIDQRDELKDRLQRLEEHHKDCGGKV